jgi:CxxC motif-containing protein
MAKSNAKLIQIRCDDDFLALLDRRASECGLDRTGYIRLVVTKSEVRVERDSGTESKVSVKREIKSEAAKLDVVRNLQEAVDRVGAPVKVNDSVLSDVISDVVPYKTGDIFVKNEASEAFDRLRRATVAFCFQNDVADESLLSKAQRLFIEENVAKLLGEVVEEEKAPEKVLEVAKSEEEFKQVWFEENDKELGGFVGSRFKIKKEKKKKKKK